MANWRGPGQLQRALFVNSDNTQTREHMAGAASTRAGQRARDARSSEGGADDSWTLSLPNNQTTSTETCKVCVFILENVNQLNESDCRQSRLSSTRIYPTECKNNKNKNNSRTQHVVVLNRTQLNLTHLFAPRSSWDEPSSTGLGLVLWGQRLRLWMGRWMGLSWAGRPLADTCAGWLIR